MITIKAKTLFSSQEQPYFNFFSTSVLVMRTSKAEILDSLLHEMEVCIDHMLNKSFLK